MLIPPTEFAVGRTGAGDETDCAMEDVDTKPGKAEKLRWLAFDAVRLCRLLSAPAVLADVEEALDTVEAFWEARRMESSRVKRLTCK